MGILRDLIRGPDPGPIVRALDLPSGPIAGSSAALGAVPTIPAVGPNATLLAMIQSEIDRRISTFTIRDALEMPSVIRGVQLICSTVAQFAPIAYRDDVPIPNQPKILRRPSPWGTRYEFLYGTTYALLAGDDAGQKAGNAFWLITDRDDERVPRQMIQLPGSEVSVEWDDRRFRPVYSWRGRTIMQDALMHIALGRRPGALLGTSPISDGLDALAALDAAEQYAAAWFTTSGVPSVTLKTKESLTPDEAFALKSQWLASRQGPSAAPAVLSGGIEDSYPDVSPEGAQLQQSRDYGNTVIARLLGIPAPLLHVATSGATITYTNTAAALEELVRATIGPTYLPPIEGALSELVPNTQAVRLDTREIWRMDAAGRIVLYGQMVGMGMLTAEDARALEGWPRSGPITSQTYAPVPNASPAPTRTEVPVA